MTRRRDTVRVVRLVEVHRRERVAASDVGQRDRADAAEGRRRGSAAASVGVDGHDGRRVAAPAVRDRDVGDGSLLDDLAVCRRTSPGPDDLDLDLAVAGPAVRDGDPGDGAVGPDRCLGRGARAVADDVHRGSGQCEWAVRPVRVRPEVVRILRRILRGRSAADHESDDAQSQHRRGYELPCPRPCASCASLRRRSPPGSPASGCACAAVHLPLLPLTSDARMPPLRLVFTRFRPEPR